MEEVTWGSNQSISKFRRLSDRLELTTAFADRFNINVAVCYIQLDGIANIKKHYGNVMMNKVLNVVDTRLSCKLREVDTIQRLNNNDFIICITNVTEKETDAIISRINKALHKEISIHDFQVTLSTNIGVAMYPTITKDKMALIENAQIAMEQAKEKGINSVVVYNGPSRRSKKVIVENDLKYAIKKEQLEVVYQPQLCLKSNKIVGFEALIRWNHPKYGMISPGDFIAFAESTGYINKLTKWVIKEVCKEVNKFPSIGDQKVSFSVNISCNQLLKDNFIEELLQLIEFQRVSPEQICFEITENIKLYSLNEVEEKIHMLKKAGIKLSIDDFGEGYFSFSNLAEIKADAVKLSKSFMDKYEEENMKGILKSMVNLAHGLGMEVVVEGVETEEQFRYLNEIGNNIIQGYFISKPISLEIAKDELLKQVNVMQEKGRLV